MATNIEHVRHTLAHLLAAAVLKSHPDAKRTIGPAIDTGFYYDFEFSSPISEEDLPRIEKDMKKILATWTSFQHKEVTPDEAREFFKDNPYKLELIDDIVAKGEKLTLYTSGDFTDLCRGGHVDNPSHDIPADSFQLDKLAGAYWRGDEKNKQLTRIYGLAFESKAKLDEYLAMIEEAKKRDHRKLGQELDLFAFSPLVGPGLPLFTPRGTVMRRLLEEYVWSLMQPYGYERVTIPHIAKSDLYKTSGHYEKFADDIFYVSSKKTDDEFIMKPMNCPHHTQIYASRGRSYRDLPLRYSEVTAVYRDENTGQLAGLTRVRSITQDDAHIFCTMDQVTDEVKNIYDIVTTFYKTFNMPLQVRLSTHDPAHQEKYLGGAAVWDRAVEQLTAILKDLGQEYEVGMGEAAFYGPKIDFIARDALGREWQLATAQLDFNLPERFELEFTAADGSKQRPVMIHRAISGSLERFLGVIIEHYAGAFPLWLAPVQVSVLPISDKHIEHATGIATELRKRGLRVEVNADNETIGKKIRASETMKVPYAIILGDKDIAANVVSVRKRGGEDLGQLKLEEFASRLTQEVIEKK